MVKMPAMIWLDVSEDAKQPMAVKAAPMSITAVNAPPRAPRLHAGGRSVIHSNILNCIQNRKQPKKAFLK